MARKRLELKTELAYFNRIEKDLLPKHKGKFALIKGKNLAGLYKTPRSAYQKGLKKFGETQFLIKEVVGKENIESIPTITHRLIRASL